MDSQVFVARTVREALRKVRTELGAEAMIVSQRRRDGMVEVTARRDDGRPATAQRAPTAPTPAPTATATPAPQEITGARARERLANLGFDDDFVDSAFGGATSRRWQDIEGAVKRLLPAAPRPVALPRGRIRVVGPAGAGRTTTVIRLATQHVLHFGSESLVLVNTDTARLAGGEAITLAGELLGVRVLEASSSKALAKVLRQTSDRALVIIDTPGLSATGAGAPALFDAPGFETCLAMPVIYRNRLLRALLANTAVLNPVAVVLTQTDAADGVANAVSLLRCSALPVCWLGYGRELDTGLEPATEDALWRCVVGDSVAPEVTSVSAPATARPRVRELAIA
jgi:flagellar biosynthesis protein FlhF